MEKCAEQELATVGWGCAEKAVGWGGAEQELHTVGWGDPCERTLVVEFMTYVKFEIIFELFSR